jgi:membrane protein implicated in regulation of membrane protease activity
MTERIGTRYYVFPQTFLGRLVGVLLAVALIVLAFFFLFFFLVIAGALASVVLLRLLWRTKRIKSQTPKDALEGEYSVVSHEEADITRKQ